MTRIELKQRVMEICEIFGCTLIYTRKGDPAILGPDNIDCAKTICRIHGDELQTLKKE